MNRKGKNKTARNIFIVVFCILLSVALTVMLGNHLKRKAEATRPDDTDTTDRTPTTTAAPPVTEMPDHTVEAGYLDLKFAPEEQKTAETIAEEFFALSYTSASFSLRDEDGSLLYTSQVATALGQKSSSSLDIGALIELLSQRDIYTVGCFDSVAFADTLSPDMYGVVLSYETALIKELFQMGVDEILITSPVLDDTNADTVLAYIAELKKGIPEDCIIGVCLPHTAFEDEDISKTLKDVSLAVDLIAVNMSGLAGEDIYTATDELVKSLEFYITRYNMRMLLAQNDPSVLTRQIDALGANAVYNWQIIK